MVRRWRSIALLQLLAQDLHVGSRVCLRFDVIVVLVRVLRQL